MRAETRGGRESRRRGARRSPGQSPQDVPRARGPRATAETRNRDGDRRRRTPRSNRAIGRRTRRAFAHARGGRARLPAAQERGATPGSHRAHRARTRRARGFASRAPSFPEARTATRPERRRSAPRTRPRARSRARRRRAARETRRRARVRRPAQHRSAVAPVRSALRARAGRPRQWPAAARDRAPRRGGSARAPVAAVPRAAVETGSKERRRRRGGEPGSRFAIDGPALAPEDERAQAQSREQHAAGALGRPLSAVLGKEAEMPSHLLAKERRRLRPPARAADVDGLRAGVEERRPAGFVQPVAPIRLLAEEEEALVERADLVERRSPQQERGAF